MHRALLAPFAALALMGQAASPPDVALWRMDCGTIALREGEAVRPVMTVSCYLIRHGDDYLVWDTGFPGALEGTSFEAEGQVYSLKQRLVPQLAQIGVRPEQVRFVAISHRHTDHTGQALDFAGATLLIGREDLEGLRVSTDPFDAPGVKPWLDGTAKADPVDGDRDVFGDGSVMMLAMPGHTPGHHVLLVRLKGLGPVLLSGDQFHTRPGYEANEMPQHSADLDATRASAARFREVATERKARVIVQHAPEDVAALPIFPEGAR